jgi:signal transduction histidine kinase
MERRRPGLWAAIGLNLALLTVAVSLLDAAVFSVVTRRVLDGAAVDLAVVTAEVVTDQLTAVGPDGWKKVVEAHRRAGSKDLTIYAPSGAVLAGEDVAMPSAARTAFFTRELAVDEAEGVVEVIAPVGVPGPPVAVLRVGLPQGATAAPAWVVIGAHSVFSALLIVLFGAGLFRGSLLRPLEQLREGTRRIAAGELGLRVSEDAPAELSELAASLNSMSAALLAYRERTAEQLRHLEEANERLQRAQDALVQSEKLASVGRLAAGLAHELGNPLAAVRGYLEILGMGDVPGADEILERCTREVERMHAILRGTLDFARQERPEAGEVDVTELLAEAARTVRHQAPFRAVDLRLHVDGAPVLWGDAAKLHQVLVNLLLNAAAAGARTIRLQASSSPEEVWIACQDDGEGVPPEHLGRLFEPFFTTRAPGQGTGLGLAVSHRILEQHGGRIDVASEPGHGACFTLRLPAGRGAAPSLPSGAA